MFQRWQRIILAALMITVPLAAGPARGKEQTGAAAAKTKKKPVKASAPAVKRGAKAHHPSSAAVMSHRQPMPPPPPKPNPYEVPQAKNLASTPDMVLNSRVRASLMAALSARNAEDIIPTTTNGVVALAGTVKSKELRARAEQVARNVHGVKAVKNQLVVK